MASEEYQKRLRRTELQQTNDKGAYWQRVEGNDTEREMQDSPPGPMVSSVREGLGQRYGGLSVDKYHRSARCKN